MARRFHLGSQKETPFFANAFAFNAIPNDFGATPRKGFCAAAGKDRTTPTMNKTAAWNIPPAILPGTAIMPPQTCGGGAALPVYHQPGGFQATLPKGGKRATGTFSNIAKMASGVPVYKRRSKEVHS